MRQATRFFLLLVVLAINAFGQSPQRYIAITFDDLPVVSLEDDVAVRQEITRKLLKNISDAKVPAIGFVNENKLYTDGKRDEAKVKLLQQWLDAGLNLGNHTFSHMNLNNNPLEKYEDEILRGETITKGLLQARSRQIRYFRHPYLMTGKTLETKQKLAEFLTAHGYTIAPVTYDNDDYVFARAYDIAKRNGDDKLRAQIGAAYIPYLESKFDYWERQSVKLFGREPKQVLLLHANSINADYFGKVAEMLKRRNYKFITLDEALADDVYKLPDLVTQDWGISWLHRWALAKGKDYVLKGEPDVPDFVMNLYKTPNPSK
ncbi:MAG TPA: polysaccharide deacetylase family protein [Pyrinomonadaceae bacterium]|nr:polysaccharide deacetylase family protein [Pyrinomonadaceae bacterium]